MPSSGKNIQLFLMDGDANGRNKCTLANRSGVAYKIPRTELDKCKNREDLKQSGVYFLFGISDETGKEVVYIGQAGGRKNGNDPTGGNITEEKESEMEGFIDYSKVIMGALRHKVFEPLSKPSVREQNFISEENDHVNDILHLERTIKNVCKVSAKGMRTAEGFVVLKGSCISPADDDNIPTIIKERRRKAKIDSQNILQEDMLFTSPSYAVVFVIGKALMDLRVGKQKIIEY